MSEDEYDHQPICDPSVERSVLGSLLLNPKTIQEARDHLQPADFYQPAHVATYEAMCRLDDRGDAEQIGVLSVAVELEHAGDVGKGDPRMYLADLVSAAGPGGVGYHARIVAQLAERRRYAEAGQRIAQAAASGIDGLGDFARHQVDAVHRDRAESEDIWDVLARVIEHPEERAGVRTGFPDLDEILPPLRPGRMTTIGARSGGGKSTLAVDFLRAAAYRQGVPALMVSVEMDTDSVVARMVSAEAGVPYSGFERPGWPWTAGQEAKIADAMHRIGSGPLVVEHVEDCGVEEVRALVRKHRPVITAVDYLQQMRKPVAERNDLALQELIYGLSRIAKTEQTHMVVLSQLNRQGDHRKDPRPQMSDLRDTSGLEHASDYILLLHRPDLYERESDRPGEVDVVIAKNRQGPAGGTVVLAAQVHMARFASLAQTWVPDPDRPTDITEPQRSAS